MFQYRKDSFKSLSMNELRKEIKYLKQMARKRHSRQGPSIHTYAKGLRIAERDLIVRLHKR